MDDNSSVLEVLGSDTDSEDLPSDPSQDDSIEDLRLLKFESLDQIERIIRLYNTVGVVKLPVEVFKHHLLMRRDSWFVEVGDVGLVYFTEVVPGLNANLNTIFWDAKFHLARRQAVLTVVRTAFERFSLLRVTALCPEQNPPYRTRLERMKFVHEGTIRKGGLAGGDMYMFGMLREELPWHVIPMPTTSLD